MLPAVAVLAGLLALTGCDQPLAAPRIPPPSRCLTSSVFGPSLTQPQVDATPSGAYLSDDGCDELARFDPATGRIAAVRELGASVDPAIEAAGSLWVTTSGSTGVTLFRLDANTLAVRGHWPIAAGDFGPSSGRLAAIGANLWVAAGSRLVRLSLPDGAVGATVTIPGAADADLAVSGDTLVDAEANSDGNGALQTRNPDTGAVLATQPMTGIAAPAIGGVSGEAVWVSESTGMQGYVQRFTGSGLSPGQDANSDVDGSNAVRAEVAQGRLWVTDPAENQYCADPVTGAPQARFSFPQPAEDRFLGVIDQRIFYSAAPDSRGEVAVATLPVPAGCK